MKEMWPVRIGGDVKQAFEKAAAKQGVDVSSLRRAAYDEYMANHPSFFEHDASKRTQSAVVSSQENAQ